MHPVIYTIVNVPGIDRRNFQITMPGKLHNSKSINTMLKIIRNAGIAKAVLLVFRRKLQNRWELKLIRSFQ